MELPTVTNHEHEWQYIRSYTHHLPAAYHTTERTEGWLWWKRTVHVWEVKGGWVSVVVREWACHCGAYKETPSEEEQQELIKKAAGDD